MPYGYVVYSNTLPTVVEMQRQASPLVQQPMCRLKILSAFGLAPTRGTVACADILFVNASQCYTVDGFTNI